MDLKMETAAPIAFVVMPFEDGFKPIFTDLIKPALEEAGYVVERADSFIDQRNILAVVVKKIAAADIVVADLTTLNPNVFYELGLAHALRRPTVMIAQSMDSVPFDLRAYRVIVYSTQFNEVHRLKTSLKEIAEKHKSGAVVFENPVTDYAPLLSEPISGEEQDLSSEPRKGFLDFILEVQDATERIARITAELTEATELHNKQLENHTESLNKATRELGSQAPQRAYQISLATASDMDAYSNTVRTLIPQLEDATNSLTDSTAGYLEWFTVTKDEDRQQLVELKKGMEKLVSTAATSRVNTLAFRDASTGLANQGISRDLTRSSSRLAAALDLTIAALTKVEAGGLRISHLAEEKLAAVESSPSQDSRSL
jgi:hypothetical protein